MWKLLFRFCVLSGLVFLKYNLILNHTVPRVNCVVSQLEVCTQSYFSIAPFTTLVWKLITMHIISFYMSHSNFCMYFKTLFTGCVFFLQL